MRSALFFFLVAACSSATWTDTFVGQDSRTNALDEAGPEDDDTVVVTSEGGPPGPECDTLAESKSGVPITVTFPGHGTESERIHIVASSGSCDLDVDSDTDSVMFVSDATPCAPLIAPGEPSEATATVYGAGSPDDLLFQWSYGECTINDDYSLSKQ